MMHKRLLPMTALAAAIAAACSPSPPQSGSIANANPPSERAQPVTRDRTGDVFVHLFEWRWLDVANECEAFLGPNGYSAVQVSPPQEHVPGPQWWTRYQPVSYRIVSRGGSRAEFTRMIERCRAAGVDIYADAITNHMADIGEGTGVAGSHYTEYSYPVPYGYEDFHHCGRNDNDSIRNYQDLWEVQNCNLGKLPDLDTSRPEVREKIAAYLNDLLDLGVAGFRLDAAKHVSHREITETLALLDSRPFIYQEVIDRGNEPINARDYLPNGSVTEFKYPQVIHDAFAKGDLDQLRELVSRADLLPTDRAIVFVDNHDIQRGHAGGEDVLNYKDGDLYTLANVFMLGWPYGYPMLMSSYEFEDSDQGPPETRPVDDRGCADGWVCEHRRDSVKSMVGFRKATAGLPVTNWQTYGQNTVSFGRGDKGHVIINIGTETIRGSFATAMEPGEYCNVLEGKANKGSCDRPVAKVDDSGFLQVTVEAMKAVVIHN